LCIGSEERGGLGCGELDCAAHGVWRSEGQAHAESADRWHIDSDLGGTVTDISQICAQVGSSLHLAGLTRLELIFAVVLAVEELREL
jgi:hypothetical protein